MTTVTEEEIERRCSERGISRRAVFPWWYRAGRTLGVPLRPPVLLNLPEHLLYGSVIVALVAGGGFVLLALTTGLNQAGAGATLGLLMVILPVINWLRFRGLRQRLDL